MIYPSKPTRPRLTNNKAWMDQQVCLPIDQDTSLLIGRLQVDAAKIRQLLSGGQAEAEEILQALKITEGDEGQQLTGAAEVSLNTLLRALDIALGDSRMQFLLFVLFLLLPGVLVYSCSGELKWLPALWCVPRPPLPISLAFHACLSSFLPLRFSLSPPFPPSAVLFPPALPSPPSPSLSSKLSPSPIANLP